MSPWEKPVPHHKWADELEAESKAKSVLRKAKLAAKKEDHSKICPYCGHEPVEIAIASTNFKDTHFCSKCKRRFMVKCPGTILLDGNPVIVQGSEQ